MIILARPTDGTALNKAGDVMIFDKKKSKIYAPV